MCNKPVEVVLFDSCGSVIEDYRLVALTLRHWCEPGVVFFKLSGALSSNSVPAVDDCVDKIIANIAPGLLCMIVDITELATYPINIRFLTSGHLSLPRTLKGVYIVLDLSNTFLTAMATAVAMKYFVCLGDFQKFASLDAARARADVLIKSQQVASG